MTAPQLGTESCSTGPGGIYGHDHFGAVAVILEGLDAITYDIGDMARNREVPIDLFQAVCGVGRGKTW